MQIVRVLEERFPQAPLYPPDAVGRVRAIRFIDWFNEVWKVAPNAIADEISSETPDLARIDGLAASMAAALDRSRRCSTDATTSSVTSSPRSTARPIPSCDTRRGATRRTTSCFTGCSTATSGSATTIRVLAAWIARVDERPRV